MAVSNTIRVLAVALALSTLSFAAGVAGDLSMTEPPRSGTSVVLRIPPELPADTLRAAPLPPLVRTAAAEARAPRVPRVVAPAEATVAPAQKPERALAPDRKVDPKQDPDRAPKTDAPAAPKGDAPALA